MTQPSTRQTAVRQAPVREANQAWESLMGAHAALMRRFAAESMWCEVSMHEYDVLYTLSKCPGSQRIGELGAHVLLSQPALSRLVDRLVDRGLLERCQDPADARAARISLTEAGREVQRRVGLAHARSVADAMSALDPHELATLRELSERLTSHPKEQS